MSPYLITGPALISFSGGRTSGYLLKQILDAHGSLLPENLHVCFANTGKEMPETLNFVQDCSDRWKVPIVWLELDYAEPHDTRIVGHDNASRAGEPFQALVDRRGFLPNPVARFCTQELKIRRLKTFMHNIVGYDRWTNIVGFRADEPRRLARLERPSRDRWLSVAPLATAGITRYDVQAWWNDQPFDLRLPNIHGTTPLGNCDLCFLKGEALIRGIIRDRPHLARWWADTEAGSRAHKPNGARFREDRPGYAEMLRDAHRQGDLFHRLDGESLDCACTD